MSCEKGNRYIDRALDVPTRSLRHGFLRLRGNVDAMIGSIVELVSNTPPDKVGQLADRIRRLDLIAFTPALDEWAANPRGATQAYNAHMCWSCRRLPSCITVRHVDQCSGRSPDVVRPPIGIKVYPVTCSNSRSSTPGLRALRTARISAKVIAALMRGGEV
jgi:hypothetical protein